ncbi:MFS general substrate transporter [Aaosphaeria arxii CBS 175.79]|uniref:MFS general substrate transporter n=1 Tax=Aaosphaeria arxii CBS 175.79 TaxID=1450172 RepID=A0A6A5XN77_9PLEO|nr:MFS general substrate transporter [Aaosphaeria arxii CBS 175.79]KAF2014339.1 MFS general substrate transporter [Aaosphaeria arxii CBS 175.79]
MATAVDTGPEKSNSKEQILPSIAATNADADSPITALPVGPQNASPTPKKSWAFKVTILSLCLVSLVVTLDATSIAIALPKIANELKTSEYVWMANCFVLSQTVVQPPCAQLCNIFGRRWPMILSLTLFAIGSGIAGGARNVGALIAGRTIQGAGSGGLNLLSELIICDLVPLRERSKYFGMVLSVGALGTILGPPIGGVIAQRDWRWIFYLNVPVAGLVILVMFFFLRLKHVREPSIRRALLRIDWIGSFLFIGATSSFLFGLISGGTSPQYAWSSFRVIVPIVLGIVGWIVFYIFETSRFCLEPSVPSHLFRTRNSSAGFYITFTSSMLMVWVAYFWPVYFQSLHSASTQQAGTNILPYVAFLIPVSVVAGVALTRFGQYLPFHFAGFALCALGLGLNTLLTQHTNTATWATFQAINGIGLAMLFPSILPAILAALPESSAATATGFFSFLRSFGLVWGITIPALIFNNEFDRLAAQRIDDPVLRAKLANGNAYESVGAETSLVKGLEEGSREQVVDVYTRALRMVWIVAVAFAVSGFLSVFVERNIPLRTSLDTEFGLDEGGGKETADVVREKKSEGRTNDSLA